MYKKDVLYRHWNLTLRVELHFPIYNKFTILHLWHNAEPTGMKLK